MPPRVSCTIDLLLINQPVQDSLRRSLHDQNMTSGIVLHFMDRQLEERRRRIEKPVKMTGFSSKTYSATFILEQDATCSSLQVSVFVGKRLKTDMPLSNTQQ